MSRGPDRLPRPGHSAAHRNKIANKLKGRKLPEEHKVAISTAMKGKAKSEEHMEKLREGLRKYHALSTEERLKRLKKTTLKRRTDAWNLRKDQRKKDLATARKAERWDLYQDILKSHGYYNGRRIFDPLVSSGYAPQLKRIVRYGEHVPGSRTVAAHRTFGLGDRWGKDRRYGGRSRKLNLDGTRGTAWRKENALKNGYTLPKKEDEDGEP